MAGFLKTKRQARQWAEQNGYTNGDFDSLYQTALGQSRGSGLRGMRARRDALFNTMQTAKNRDFIYEDQDAGEQAAYADLQKNII